MKTFLIKLQGKAKVQGAKFKVPPEFIDEYIMDKMRWSELELRSTPAWRIQKLLEYWHLVSIAEDAEDRKRNAKNKKP